MIYYKYDQNKRVYTDPVTGIKSNRPIRKYAYQAYKIVEETSRSLVLGYNFNHRSLNNEIKVPKKASLKEYGFLTEEEKNQDIWMANNRHELSQIINYSKDFNILQEVANLLNYKETI